MLHQKSLQPQCKILSSPESWWKSSCKFLLCSFAPVIGFAFNPFSSSIGKSLNNNPFFLKFLGHIIDTEDLEIIKTGHLHRVLPNVYQKFIKAPKTDRMNYLLDIIEPDVDKKRKVLIFCNKGSTSAFLNHYLNEKGIKTLHFAGGNMNPNHRCVDHEIFFLP